MNKSILLLTILLSTAANAAQYDAAFSPKGGATELVVKTIQEAKTSVKVAAYSFTSGPIAKALIDAKNRGLDVKVVLDKSNKTVRYSAATFMKNQKVPTRIDSKYAIMHNKFILIDDDTIELGSFNYTKNAENSNAENVLVLHGEKMIVEDYANEFKRLWDESEEMK